MKKIIIIAAILALVLVGCKKNVEQTPDTTAGVTETAVATDTDTGAVTE